MRSPRDPRRASDPRDKRDTREGDDPRDPRDPRAPGDARDWIAPRARLNLILAFLVTWLGSTGALVVYGKGIDHNAKHTAHAQVVASTATANLRTYQISSCKRENVMRVSQNKSQLNDYHFDTSITKLLERGLARPLLRIPGLDPRRQQEERTEAGALLNTAKTAADGKEWGHLIENCTMVVDHPSLYVFPPLVQFSHTGSHHTPPRGALELQPGE